MAYAFDNFNDDDICGQEYRDFIDLCFCYSKYFALHYEPLMIRGDSNPFGAAELPELSPFKISSFTDTESSGHPSTICIYTCTEKGKRFLQNHVNSLFDWQSYWDGHHNPQDPTFFRADGSIFSFSLIHEGFSEVYNRDDEDVTLLASNPTWAKFDGKCRWTLPQRISSYLLEII